MPQRDAHHEIVKLALIKEGWTITHDPLTIKHKGLRVFIDLAAEKALPEERRRVAVEIKVFSGQSGVDNFEKAVGQYSLFHAAMATEPAEPESIPICDPVHDNYLAMDVGWEDDERAYYVVFHLRLKDGKVRVERDGIEYGIARDLIEAGIAKEDIVMAFYGREPRPLTELMAA